jgi:hypothetical protein
VVAAAVLAAALASVPGVAQAKPGYFVAPGDRVATFAFDGTNGFRLRVQAIAGLGLKRPRIDIDAIRGREFGGYISKGPVTFGRDGSIAAQIPGVGQIDVAFHPTRSKQEPELPGCRGRATVEEHGIFRGTISVRGRRGFTEAHLRSTPGQFARTFRQVCEQGKHKHRYHQAEGTDFRVTSLEAHRDAGGLYLGLFASSASFEATSPRPDFTAFASDSGGKFDYFGVVNSGGTPEAFAVPDLSTLASAVVEPPAPFSGSAEYQSLGPKSSTWTGDLAVSIPGFGRVSLTGPKFKSSLCEDERCTGSPRPKSHLDVSVIVGRLR